LEIWHDGRLVARCSEGLWMLEGRKQARVHLDLGSASSRQAP
jgi:hypothetical protein